MLQPELKAVATQPSALKRGDEETGTCPRPVVPITVNSSHTPEVHVSNFQRSVAGHVKSPIGWAEVIVNTSVHTEFPKTEVFIGGQFKEDVITRRWLGPIQSRLGVSGQVIAGLIPYGQTIDWGG